MISLEDAHWRLAFPASCAGCPGKRRQELVLPLMWVYDYENLEVLPAEVVHDLPGGMEKMTASQGLQVCVDQWRSDDT